MREDTAESVTTYLDNPFLGPTQIAAIEAYKSDERWWKVYGLGQTGTHKGLIYTNWTQCKEIPDNARLVGRGLDFGYSADPTAIVAVYMMNGELYLDEELYESGLTNDRIAKALVGKSGYIVADSAEPKSIDELRNYGVRNIEPSVKGPDSVRNGIQVVEQYRLNVTQRSLNLIRELRNYKWAEDKVTGELKNEPAKNEHFDHALDALRYLVSSKLQQRRRGTARSHLTKLY
jgi:phage terminase large subunit